MAQARRCARPPLSLELTIPDDERFVETARALSVRVAEFVGYEGPEAAAIGAAVVEALAALVARRAEPANGCLEVHFSTRRGRMTIDLARASSNGTARRRGPAVRLTRPLPPVSADSPA